jgi:succinate dehydrogenase/fumarate reductase flavoprotein subunit
MYDHDVIVLGGGGTGLVVALSAAKAARGFYLMRV